MLMQRVLSYCYKSAISRRFINRSAKNFESKISDTSKVSSSASASSSTGTSESVVGPKMIAPDGFDKWVLVWMKKYPKGQVPDRVKEEVLYQTKSRARIKMANYMTAFAIVMCIVTAISGRKARDDGDSLRKRGLEWEKRINEERLAELDKKS